MQKTWTNENINVELLTKNITKFFEENYFDITKQKTSEGYQLQAKSSPNYIINGQVNVTINGKPEEFSITMELQRKESRIPSFPLILTTFFGGGFLLTQHFKSEESWMTFQKDFWQYVDITILHLRGTHKTNKIANSKHNTQIKTRYQKPKEQTQLPKQTHQPPKKVEEDTHTDV